MRKSLCFALIVLMVLFSGCSAASQEPQQLPEQPLLQQTELPEYGDFYELTGVGESGELMEKAIHEKYTDGTYYMRFHTDFDTMTVSPACGVQGCMHTSAECPAWIPFSLPVNGITRFFALGNSVIRVGGDGMIKLLSADGKETIDLVDLGIQPQYGIWSDGEYLAAIIDSGELAVIDAASFKIVQQHDTGPADVFCGMAGDRAVFLRHQGRDTVMQYYYTLDLSDGSTEYVRDREGRRFLSGHVKNGKLFASVYDEDENMVGLKVISIASGSCSGAVPFEYESFEVMYADDDGAVITVRERGVMAGSYYLSFANETVDPIELPFVLHINGIEKVAPRIIAACGDDFYVSSGAVWCGDEEQMPMHYWDSVSGWYGYREQYALISRSDYLAGLPNYRQLKITA